ncbi:MAG: glycosyltransferase family A protein, partial [Nitrososphaerota archaeon]
MIIASTRKKVLLLERSEELAKMDNIEVLVVTGGTAGANRNLGVSKSKGELLLFLDDDVVIDFRVLDKVS